MREGLSQPSWHLLQVRPSVTLQGDGLGREVRVRTPMGQNLLSQSQAQRTDELKQLLTGSPYEG